MAVGSVSVPYFLGNVPGSFHSYDLRAFFSHLVESGAFACFHFRHRPEYRKLHKPKTDAGQEPHHVDTVVTDTVTDTVGTVGAVRDKTKLQIAGTLCCVLLVKKTFEKELLNYSGEFWADMNNEIVTKLTVKLKSLKENSQPTHPQVINDILTDIYSLPELNPPKVMPQGNVGTPLCVFRELIRSCRLPPHIIKKLKLKFPLCQSKRIYSTVPLDYGMSRGDRTLTEMSEGMKNIRESKRKRKRVNIGKEDQQDIANEDHHESDTDTDDDFGAEDWERYEALHNDVDKQDRTGERLFEEEMEVVWDKGSSGLVFYTDANYWDELDGDFDEKCSKEDDWDVDMSLYYGYESADKTACDLRDIEIEKRLRAGEDLEDIMNAKSHHKRQQLYEGIGGKLMKEKGWIIGSGLGKSSTGISEPLVAEGQRPHCKSGLGYRGEKVSHYRSAVKTTRDVLISTVYDKPNEEKDNILKSPPTSTLKYRKQ